MAVPVGFTSTSAARAPKAITTAATEIQNLRMTAYATQCSRFRKINSRPAKKSEPAIAMPLTVAIPALFNMRSLVCPLRWKLTYAVFVPQERPAFWSTFFSGRKRKAAAAPEVTGSQAAEAEKRCILVVDDHNDTLFSMKILLKRLGYKVLTAKNMNDALGIAEKQHFDILLSDIGLPDGTGLELLRHRSTRCSALALGGFGWTKT